VKGRALAAASAAKPLRRATVARKLGELVERMVHVNKSGDFLVGIESAYVYGSYLGATESLGDLDISLSFYRNETNGKGAIRRHERLGGVLGHYRREAA
jgi:hypothetical protein